MSELIHALFYIAFLIIGFVLGQLAQKDKVDKAKQDLINRFPEIPSKQPTRRFIKAMGKRTERQEEQKGAKDAMKEALDEHFKDKNYVFVQK